MGWRRKEKETAVQYERLTERIPKGYVPMLVGSEEGEAERFLVRVKHLSDPCIVALLEKAAQEFGYGQKGILRIPCDAQQFRDMVHVISKDR
ncbi:putative auxin-responsive protein SAUR71-like [Cocos nucifera]|uniref:Putative auxin-responsive protein SAUR71-like n=1 Tax=Cocos nucifera TaxID=13894 RepID=A0A8K0IVI5_COCNU|nr:putative auxin-responsive protein SAUR71-like [Cocos nucifera]